jgi:hypothetical protein
LPSEKGAATATKRVLVVLPYVSEVITLFKQVVDAFVASRQWDSASLSRLAFWVEMLGDRIISEVTADQVDNAIAAFDQLMRELLQSTFTGESFDGF